MRKRKKIYSCGLEAALAVIGGKWKMALLWRLSQRSWRYNELRRDLKRVTHRMLTKQLRELERDGLIVRTVHPVVPPHVDYALTDTGRTLIGPLAERDPRDEADEDRPALAVVLVDLVHPALADVGHVDGDARRGEAGEVAHDVVLELLGLGFELADLVRAFRETGGRTGGLEGGLRRIDHSLCGTRGTSL